MDRVILIWISLVMETVVQSKRGKQHIVNNGYVYRCYRTVTDFKYYRCIKLKCKGKMKKMRKVLWFFRVNTVIHQMKKHWKTEMWRYDEKNAQERKQYQFPEYLMKKWLNSWMQN